MKRRVLAAIIAAVFALLNVASALPAIALGEKEAVRYPTPEGYNDNDYQKLVAFLEIEDDAGIKNGQKVKPSYNNGLNEAYDPNDPETWGEAFIYDYEVDNYILQPAFQWTSVNGEKRISLISLYWWYSYDLVGFLDVSNCSELEYLNCSVNDLEGMNVFGCSALELLGCGYNNIENLDVSSNCSLGTLICNNNCLNTLDVSNNFMLEILNCENNMLIELDLSNCPSLEKFLCIGNRITELDLSNNPELPLEFLRAEGRGTIGYNYPSNTTEFPNELLVQALPAEGADFEGFYYQSGNFLFEGEPNEDWGLGYYYFPFQPWEPTGPVMDPSETMLIARFTGWDEQNQGDANGDGEVNASDALLVLRFALGLAELPCDESVCDMNGDGVVNSADALIVLRISLGIAK